MAKREKPGFVAVLSRQAWCVLDFDCAGKTQEEGGIKVWIGAWRSILAGEIWTFGGYFDGKLVLSDIALIDLDRLWNTQDKSASRMTAVSLA